MTASAAEGALDLARLIPGVTCEACHGPASQARGAAAETGRLASEARHATANPRRFDPTTSVDFCGACHSTWWDVTLAGEKGIAALRSQPFRLQSSRCWGEGDARLACVACHDPHEPLGPGSSGLRPALPGLSRSGPRADYGQRRRETPRPRCRVALALRPRVQGRNEGLHDVSHAEVRGARDALQVHGSPDTGCSREGLGSRVG